MIDLPALTVFKGKMDTLRDVKEAELVDVPELRQCVLPNAFRLIRNVHVENAGKLESNKEIKALLKKKREEEKLDYVALVKCDDPIRTVHPSTN